METTSSYLQTEDGPFDEGLLRQQGQVRSDEESFRALLGKVTISAIFLASSLIVYYLMPFYPPTMAVFLALIPAVIAYRWPAVALFLMLLFAAPAYSYQLGVTIWMLGILVSIAVVLPFSLSRLPGASLSCAVGAAAAVLMLTPYFYFALPLLAGITLLQLRGSLVGGAWGLFIFLTFYIPFLILADTSAAQGETIPLFLSVDYAQQPHLSNLDLSSLKSAFEGQINNSFSGFPGFPSYFIEGWGGIALILTMLVAVVITPAIVNTATRLAVALTFLVPLQLLAKPLGYHTGFATWNDIALLVGLMLALGVAATIAETWLSRRNIKVELKSDLAMLSLDLYELLDDAKKHLQQVAYVCPNNNLADEKSAIAQCEEKVALTLESISAMGLSRLELSYNEFCDMLSQLPKLQLQLETKLFNHLEESRHTYKSTVNEALALGIPDLQDIIQELSPSSEERDYDKALTEQDRLNKAFEELADKLISAGDTVANTIKDEIDPEFSLTTIDIGHGFLDQGRFEEAAQTIAEDLKIIDGRIEGSIIELAGKVAAMANSFREVVTSRLIPVVESIGDSNTLAKYNDTVAELDAIVRSVHNSRTLADIISIVEQSRKLVDLATNTVRELSQRINSMEADNDRRCPAKYNWGKNSHAVSEVQQLLSSIEHIPSEPTISARFNAIEKAVQAVEHQAKAIKQYSRTNEFLINYPNIEYILQEKLTINAGVAGRNLPVKLKYAQEYLKLYAAKHSSEVTFDSKSGVLKHSTSNATSQDETSP
jgi:hypothetical protein